MKRTDEWTAYRIKCSLFLQRGHFNPKNSFDFRRQRFLHILDNSPKDVRSQLLVKICKLAKRSKTIVMSLKVINANHYC